MASALPFSSSASSSRAIVGCQYFWTFALARGLRLTVHVHIGRLRLGLLGDLNQLGREALSAGLLNRTIDVGCSAVSVGLACT